MYTLFNLLFFGIMENEPTMIIQALADFLPILAISIIALIFGILNYRTNKKILKKLEGMESK